MLPVVGLLMIVIIVILLTKFNFLPAVVFTTLPIAIALLLGTGFSDTMRMAAVGVSRILPIAALFIGSITYFGIMSDAGLFDGLIKFLVSKLKNNITVFFIIAACLTLVTHLDGSGTTTLGYSLSALS